MNGCNECTKGGYVDRYLYALGRWLGGIISESVSRQIGKWTDYRLLWNDEGGGPEHFDVGRLHKRGMQAILGRRIAALL